MSVMPSQVELRLATPHQHQSNQAKGVNGVGARPQLQQRVPTNNANFFIALLQSM